MKTTTLVIGLVQVVFAVCGCLTATAFGPWLVPVFVLAAAVNAGFGTSAVLESLFGDGGLICELFGKVDAANDD